MVRRASEGTLSAGDRSQSSRALDRQHAQAFKLFNHAVGESKSSMTGRMRKGGRHGGNGTELFVIRAWILRGVLEYVRRAGGKTTVGEDARLDLR